ncbi:flagellar filament capping protein FliD [Desulfotalea psychrophila]|uniref:Flagellar hook-associated protein 2 n=1 Tax=Desulfotalea psychrophila (strain LSv54 / DSM 12343) TaxID=177439 RepID=Q6AMN7_DESPS|nr:flagellar filament capping protein FliD [Desulfotalea psychrophila]CAG36388.1 related to flagellar hook-associated protein 2 [Desulfotalea psychrophila LSv54]
MGDISFGGLATGLPTEDLIAGLMKAESKPLDRLEKQKTNDATHLEAYEEYNDLLDELRESVSAMHLTSDVRTTDVKLSNEDTLSASSSGAATGSYNVAVTQLAQVQKNVTAGVSSQSEAMFSNGHLTINDTKIVFDGDKTNLDGMLEAINSVADKTGVTASIINDGKETDNYHLVFAGKDASTDFTISTDLKVKGAEGETVDFANTRTSVAQQSIAYVDGIEIQSNSNTLKGVVGGLTLNLNEVSKVISPADGDTPAVYATTVVELTANSDSLKEKIEGFVSAYNKAMDWIVSGYEYKAENDKKIDASSSDAEKEAAAGQKSKKLSNLLRGDPTLNKAKRELQSILGESADNSSKFNILSEIGIKTQRDGTLLVNKTKLDKALDENYGDVVTLFAGDASKDGLMDKLNSKLLEQTSATRGVYAEKKGHYKATGKRIDKQIANQKTQLESIEKRYRAQFTALELLVSKMNSQSSYISQYLTDSTSK